MSCSHPEGARRPTRPCTGSSLSGAARAGSGTRSGWVRASPGKCPSWTSDAWASSTTRRAAAAVRFGAYGSAGPLQAQLRLTHLQSKAGGGGRGTGSGLGVLRRHPQIPGHRQFPRCGGGCRRAAFRALQGFLDYSQHRGLITNAARVRHPKDKPHVEWGVQYVRDHIFKGNNVASLQDMRDESGPLVSGFRRTAGPRHHPESAPAGLRPAHRESSSQPLRGLLVRPVLHAVSPAPLYPGPVQAASTKPLQRPERPGMAHRREGPEREAGGSGPVGLEPILITPFPCGCYPFLG